MNPEITCITHPPMETHLSDGPGRYIAPTFVVEPDVMSHEDFVLIRPVPKGTVLRPDERVIVEAIDTRVSHLGSVVPSSSRPGMVLAMWRTEGGYTNEPLRTEVHHFHMKLDPMPLDETTGEVLANLDDKVQRALLDVIGRTYQLAVTTEAGVTFDGYGKLLAGMNPYRDNGVLTVKEPLLNGRAQYNKWVRIDEDSMYRAGRTEKPFGFEIVRTLNVNFPKSKPMLIGQGFMTTFPFVEDVTEALRLTMQLGPSDRQKAVPLETQVRKVVRPYFRFFSDEAERELA